MMPSLSNNSERQHASSQYLKPQIVDNGEPKKQVAFRLAFGFGSVAVIALLMGIVLVALIAEVSGLVMNMRHDEVAIKEGLTLSMAVREQYMHQAHWIIERDNAHLSHANEWLARVEQSIEVLQPLVSQKELLRLVGVKNNAHALHILFQDSIMPAVKRGDNKALQTYHHRTLQISSKLNRDADAIARSMEHKMASSHVSATHFSRIGLWAGSLCMLVILLLSVWHTLRLRQMVLKPLQTISEAARRLGAGDFSTRLGDVGEGELHAVAQTFDQMAGELESREKRLVSQARMAAIGQLAAGVAHEINNPIGIIRGYLKTMGPDSTPEELQKELAILDEEAAACQRIAEDLVEFSRIGNMQQKSEAVDELIQTSVQRLRDVIDMQDALTTKSMQIHVNAEPGLAYVDAGRIRQVLFNLLLNAVQVSEKGGQVRVVGMVLDGGYQIQVIDEGPGIEAGDHSKIFEPFFSKRQGGTGLGLSVCQGIVQAHSSEVLVKSKVGQGTEFSFVLQTLARQEGEKKDAS